MRENLSTLKWFKSSYSGGNDGNSCVEVAITLNWFKSSHSGGTDGNSCVEVARAPRAIHVRDSKHAAGPRLAVAQDTWTAFLTGVRD